MNSNNHYRANEATPSNPSVNRPVDLDIAENILTRVKEVVRDPNLNSSEARYLENLILDCGKRGVCFSRRSTLAREISVSKSTAKQIERSLRDKGYIVVWEHKGVWHRSPWPDYVKNWKAGVKKDPPKPPSSPSGSSPEPPKPATVNQQSPSRSENNPPPPAPMPEKPAPKAESTQLPTGPCTREPVQERSSLKPSTGAPTPPPPVDNSAKSAPPKNSEKKVSKEEFHKQPAETTTDKKPKDLFKKPKTENKNPFKKNRWLVKHMVDQIADTLNIWKSWKWLCKLVWSVDEKTEYYVYDCVSWVKEELACCRCNNAFGLLRWKLRQEGVLPPALWGA